MMSLNWDKILKEETRGGGEKKEGERKNVFDRNPKADMLPIFVFGSNRIYFLFSFIHSV